MQLKDINVIDTIMQIKQVFAKQKNVSKEFQSLFSLLITIVELFIPLLIKKNSKNSSIPPSHDPYRQKESKKPTGRKPGGQPGHVGKRLKSFDTPDEVIVVTVNRQKLPTDKIYSHSRVIKRQVVNVLIARIVTEYQLEVLVDDSNKEYIAECPKNVSQTVQYGDSVKALSTYMNQYQMIPYARVESFFKDHQAQPISQGSIFNFNKEVYNALESFDSSAKQALKDAKLLLVVETGININGKLHWLHNASNENYTLLFPHAKRGKEGIDEMGILPNFKGIMIHDHWKSYYSYDCKHALCNAHHLRELTAIIEQHPDHLWSLQMKDFLLSLNKRVDESGGCLRVKERKKYCKEYRDILKGGEKECPPPIRNETEKKRGRIKKSKERNLLERLIDFEQDILRFMYNKDVPFTNNQGERDLRMIKVQQKISGCFKTIETAKMHARIRSFILSAQKQGMPAKQAIDSLFSQQNDLLKII